jgi:hypothetical protein
VLRGTDELLARTVGPLVKLRLLLDPAVRPAIADVNQLELAILNLAINARDAMPEGGQLTIATEREVVAPAELFAPAPRLTFSHPTYRARRHLRSRQARHRVALPVNSALAFAERDRPKGARTSS